MDIPVILRPDQPAYEFPIPGTDYAIHIKGMNLEMLESLVKASMIGMILTEDEMRLPEQERINLFDSRGERTVEAFNVAFDNLVMWGIENQGILIEKKVFTKGLKLLHDKLKGTGQKYDNAKQAQVWIITKVLMPPLILLEEGGQPAPNGARMLLYAFMKEISYRESTAIGYNNVMTQMKAADKLIKAEKVQAVEK